MFRIYHGRSSVIVLLAAVIIATALSPRTVSATVHTPPWADVFGSQWNDLDTTTAASNFKTTLTSGYTRFLTLNSTATTAMGGSYAQSDAVWVTFGHGGPGFITYCNPPGGSSCTTVLRANAAIGSCSVGGDCVSDYPTQIHQVRLMVFAGCDTGFDGAPSGTNAGNLVKQAVNSDGVDSAIGWKGLVYFNGSAQPGEMWATRDAVYLNAGNSVNASAYAAGQDVKNANSGNGFGWELYWSLNGGVKIIPPAYGS